MKCEMCEEDNGELHLLESTGQMVCSECDEFLEGIDNGEVKIIAKTEE